MANAFGRLIVETTKLQPFWMGMLVSVLVGIALTLPISSAAICAAFGLTGLAGGAAVAGCCANMVGFAVMSFRENRWGGLVSQGLGTSMLQMGNIVKNPRIWLPPIIASAITGPLATCVFGLEMNGAPINSGWAPAPVRAVGRLDRLAQPQRYRACQRSLRHRSRRRRLDWPYPYFIRPPCRSLCSAGPSVPPEGLD